MFEYLKESFTMSKNNDKNLKIKVSKNGTFKIPADIKKILKVEALEARIENDILKLQQIDNENIS